MNSLVIVLFASVRCVYGWGEDGHETVRYDLTPIPMYNLLRPPFRYTAMQIGLLIHRARPWLPNLHVAPSKMPLPLCSPL